MAVVIGSASIRITALTREMKREITRDLNEALREVKADFDPIESQARQLRGSLSGAKDESHGLASTLRVLGGAMDIAQGSGRLLTGVLKGLGVASAVSLASMAAFAGGGGLVAVAGALAATAGAALLIPAALGAAGIAVGTLVVGFQGMGDAFKNIGDPAKFAEALKDLSPNARAFAVAVHDMLPAFKELRLQVQDRLFAGLAAEFSELGKIHLPVVQAGLSKMADSLNLNAHAFADFARQKQTVADLGTLFTNSSLSVGLLSHAVQPLLGALRDIGTVGSTFLPALAGGLAQAAQEFGTFISQARESGKLQEWIQGGIDALGQLFSILGNIGSIIGSVFSAGQAMGGGLLSTLDQLTESFAGFLNSAEGQTALSDFFGAVGEAARAVMPVIQAVATVIGSSLAPVLADIATAVGPAVAVVVRELGKALDIARPGIEALAQGFGSFLVSLAPILPHIGRLVEVLGKGLGTVLERLGPVLEEVISAIADALSEALSNPDLINGIIAVAEAFGELLVGLVPLIPPLMEIAAELLPVFADIIQALLPLLPPLVELMEALVPIFGVLADVVTLLLVPISGLIIGLGGLITFMANAVTGLGEFAVGVSTAMGISSGAVTGFETSARGSLVDRLPGTVLGPAGLAVTQFGLDFTQKFQLAAAGAEASMQRIGAAVLGNVEPLGAAGAGIGGRFSAGLSGTLGLAIGSANSIMGEIGSVLSSGNFGAAGSAVTRSFATGMVGSAALAAVRSASNTVMNAAGSALPRSPAKEGPFSGRGWTLYRGQALMAGFAAGIRRGLPDVRYATLNAMGATATGLSGIPGTTPAGLPSVVPGSRVPSVATRPETNSAELHASILAAISGWQVVVSAREAASQVNRVNKENASR